MVPGEVGRGGESKERHVVEESVRVEAGVQQAAAHRDVLRMRTRDENKEFISGRTANNAHQGLKQRVYNWQNSEQCAPRMTTKSI